MLRQVREHGTAEELYQDVWQQVITRARALPPDARFSTWLFQIAHNRLDRPLARAQHRPPPPEDAMERAEREPTRIARSAAVGLRGTPPPAAGAGGTARGQRESGAAAPRAELSLERSARSPASGARR
jgi:DNA-directed RNA polymerase specialized sigma24 family protein